MSTFTQEPNMNPLGKTKYFEGNNILEWIQYFGLNKTNEDFLLKEIEVQTVDDLNYVYDDEILLKQIHDFFDVNQYEVFLEAKRKTMRLRARSNKKTKTGILEDEGEAEPRQATLQPETINHMVQQSEKANKDLSLQLAQLMQRNKELEEKVQIQEERYHVLESKYREVKSELKKYIDQTIYLSKDAHYEKQKAAQLFQDLQKVNKEKEMLDGGGNDCMICREQIKNLVFIPCMHIAICQGCHKELELKQCPICRVNVEDTKVVYW